MRPSLRLPPYVRRYSQPEDQDLQVRWRKHQYRVRSVLDCRTRCPHDVRDDRHKLKAGQPYWINPICPQRDHHECSKCNRIDQKMAEIRIQEELPSTKDQMVQSVEGKHSNENKRKMAFWFGSLPQCKENEY